jgi:hypothetical protein
MSGARPALPAAVRHGGRKPANPNPSQKNTAATTDRASTAGTQRLQPGTTQQATHPSQTCPTQPRWNYQSSHPSRSTDRSHMRHLPTPRGVIADDPSEVQPISVEFEGQVESSAARAVKAYVKADSNFWTVRTCRIRGCV